MKGKFVLIGAGSAMFARGSGKEDATEKIKQAVICYIHALEEHGLPVGDFTNSLD